MTDDINERIARLVEPEPKFLRGSRNPSVGDVWMQDCDGFRIPRTFTASLDASMAVIAAKFDVLSSVELFVECDRSGAVTNRCVTLNTNCGDVFVGRADTYAHALALALLAALEAEQ